LAFFSPPPHRDSSDLAINRDKVVAAAQKHIQKGAFKRAVKEYEKLIKEHPDDVRTLQKIADLYARAGNKEDAVSTYNEVADHYVAQGFFLKAVAIYKQLLEVAPERLEARLRLADLYVQLSLLRDALSNYQKVADRYLDMGWTDAYLSTLERIVEVDPDNAGNRIQFGEQLLKHGHEETAAPQFAQAADILRGTGRYEEYAKVAERYVHLRPDDVPATHTLCRVYLDQGRAKRALARIQTVFREEPTNKESLDILVDALLAIGEGARATEMLAELGETFANEGATGASENAYQKLLELDPTNVAARAALGLADGDPVQPAPSKAGPVATVAPAATVDVDKLLAETDVYLKYDLHDKALEHLKHVFAVDPANAGALERQKSVLLSKGDKPAAVEALLRLATASQETDPVAALTYAKEAEALIPGNADVAAIFSALEAGTPLAPAPPPPVARQATPSASSEQIDALIDQFDAGEDSGIGHQALSDDQQFISEVANSIEGTVSESTGTTGEVVAFDDGDILPADLDDALMLIDQQVESGEFDEASSALFELLGEWPGHDEMLMDRMDELTKLRPVNPNTAAAAQGMGDREANPADDALDFLASSSAALSNTEELSADELSADEFSADEFSADSLSIEIVEEVTVSSSPPTAPSGPAPVQLVDDDDDLFLIEDDDVVEHVAPSPSLDKGRITGSLEETAAGDYIAELLDSASVEPLNTANPPVADGALAGEIPRASASSMSAPAPPAPIDRTEEVRVAADHDWVDEEFEDLDDDALDAFSDSVIEAPQGRPSRSVTRAFGPSDQAIVSADLPSLVEAIGQRRAGDGMLAMLVLQEHLAGPHGAAAQFELAVANMELGLYVDAVSELEKLLSIAGVDVSDRLVLHYYIGIGYEALHQPDTALRHFQSVDARDPVGFPDVGMRIKRLSAASA
jgi:pilus assembly protein FimV